MFICEVCNEQFSNDQMSEEENVCKDCYDEMELATLLAIEII
jgi:formylmethanofuran dehydrogenase subunit E